MAASTTSSGSISGAGSQAFRCRWSPCGPQETVNTSAARTAPYARPEPGPETATSHVVAGVVSTRADEAVGAILDRLRAQPGGSLEAVFLVDGAGRLEGAVRLVDLIAAPPHTPIGALADRGYPRVRADSDQEQVAQEALRGQATSVAVVDGSGRWGKSRTGMTRSGIVDCALVSSVIVIRVGAAVEPAFGWTRPAAMYPLRRAWAERCGVSRYRS